jgi:cytochrome c oxidase subunit 1/cytochrome c oxidase subunit I+III
MTAANPDLHEAETHGSHAAALDDDAHARGIFGWFTTVDHKRIGILYLLTALVFFAIGGSEAFLIRLQLAHPNAHVVSPEAFNELFTMHGTTMIFLVVMPALAGFANYLIPLMIGARDMAFPRLNALSYWLLPFGGLLLHFSVVAGGAPSGGWFSYAPLSETPYSSTLGTDYWALSILLLGIGSVGGAINIIATVITLRAPGMTMRRLPLFVWMTFVTAILIILALPVLNAGLAMLLIDRRLDAHFFQANGGGSAILWQHVFWTFGHPEVYILALPAFGMISEVIPVFSRKPIFGYEFVAGSTVAIAIMSFGVWAHHMFAAGLGHKADLFFAIGSMAIAVPTGVKIFNWIATMWGGSIRFTTAMLFATAFLIEFVIGGLSGITFAAAPVDWQVTDTYYLVAHFHYVAFGGVAFGILAATYYWFPKITGRLLDERWGVAHFWLTVVGFNLTFFVHHFLGIMGMPRRVYTYPDLPGWGALNMASTIGAGITGLSVVVFLVNVVRSLRSGKLAGDNPWDGWTLEWAATSPPDHHNFDRVPPVRGRRPLWDLGHPGAVPSHDTAGKERPPPDKAIVSVWTFIVSEAGFFLVLILSYVFFNVSTKAAAAALDAKTTGIFTAFLLASSGTLMVAERSLEHGKEASCRLWLLVTIALGAVFMAGQANEYRKLFEGGLYVNSSLFASTFFTLTGFHGLHVTLGLVALGIVASLAFGKDLSAASPKGAAASQKAAASPKGAAANQKSAASQRLGRALQAVGLYWHFVDVVWIAVFSIVYVRSAL